MGDFGWLLVSSVLVFVMQAGFLCLESGRVRSKNSINVAAKNISDFVVAAIIFWLFGFAIMFGESFNGILGTHLFLFGENQSPYDLSFFLFQMMFCGTAATLMSGAVAERMTYNGYLFITIILCAFIYPIVGHWAWSSVFLLGNEGWLEAMGFYDFAGATVVHSVGGWVALAAIIIIGPRIGRFAQGISLPPGNSLPLSTLGVLLIWMGWFGFNGGSTLILSNDVPLIILNTSLAAAWGGIAATLYFRFRFRYVDVGTIMNGVIAGLVAVTAGADSFGTVAASTIGAIAGILATLGSQLMENRKLDDALGVVPAHLIAGIWGTLAVALFGDLDSLNTGLNRLEQFGVQAFGISVIGAYAFGLSYLIMKGINHYIPLRISTEDELTGLNIVEHRASTELIDLLTSMQKQHKDGNFSEQVPVEPFTEVGQIATQYNQVIDRVRSEIGKRDRAITDFRSSERRKSAILNSSMDSIVTIDLNGKIIEFNPAAERCFGCFKNRVKGHDFITSFVLEAEREKTRQDLAQLFSLSNGLKLNRRNEIHLQRISGDHFPAEITITSTSVGTFNIDEFTLHIRDVTRQRKLQDRLSFLAFSDPLTGLYNRTFLMERLSRNLDAAKDEEETLVVFFMDLDKFKRINDTMGHKAGDQLLVEFSDRLTRLTREDDIIARWGGDEFVILMSGHMTEETAKRKAEEILTAMSQPIMLEGQNFTIPTSIGIAMSGEARNNADQMIQSADIAMYQAKINGRNNYQIFAEEMAKQASKSFQRENALKEALKSDQIYMMYQPKIDASTTELVGMEALIRWNHPTEGPISPGEFIPMAEESNLIITLDQRVLNDVLGQIKNWRDMGLDTVPVAVNISGKHLVAEGFTDYIRDQLDKFQLPGSCLEIEITEGALISDMERCIAVISELKTMNIQLSIDDFGTGYSSLNYLKRLPIDILKIDQSFVRDCHEIEEDQKICSVIIGLAQSLQMKTVAEGVEYKSQQTFLKEQGCDFFQGFLFYRPMAASDLTDLLSQTSVKSSQSA